MRRPQKYEKHYEDPSLVPTVTVGPRPASLRFPQVPTAWRMGTPFLSLPSLPFTSVAPSLTSPSYP